MPSAAGKNLQRFSLTAQSLRSTLCVSQGTWSHTFYHEQREEASWNRLQLKSTCLFVAMDSALAWWKPRRRKMVDEAQRRGETRFIRLLDHRVTCPPPIHGRDYQRKAIYHRETQQCQWNLNLPSSFCLPLGSTPLVRSQTKPTSFCGINAQITDNKGILETTAVLMSPDVPLTLMRLKSLCHTILPPGYSYF